MPIDQVEQLRDLSDSRSLVAINILSAITACAFLLGNAGLMRLSVLRGLNLVLKAGKSDLLGSQLSWFSVLLVLNRDYVRSTAVAKQTLKLLKIYPNARELANSYNALAALALPISETYTFCSQQHQKGYEVGFQNGDIARGVITVSYTHLTLPTKA